MKWLELRVYTKLFENGLLVQEQEACLCQRLFHNTKQQRLKKNWKEDFTASNGWLESFKRRHQIMWRGYEPHNIANGDETRLFFQAVPSKTLFSKRWTMHSRETFKREVNSFLMWLYVWQTWKTISYSEGCETKVFQEHWFKEFTCWMEK